MIWKGHGCRNRHDLCPPELIVTIKVVGVPGGCTHVNTMWTGLECRLVEHDRGPPDQREMRLDARPIPALPQGIVIRPPDQPQVLIQRPMRKDGTGNLTCRAVVTKRPTRTRNRSRNRGCDSGVGHHLQRIPEKGLAEHARQNFVLDETSESGGRSSSRDRCAGDRSHSQRCNTEKDDSGTQRERRRRARIRASGQGCSPLHQVRLSFGSWPLSPDASNKAQPDWPSAYITGRELKCALAGRKAS
jgi:hypothetical protein